MDVLGWQKDNPDFPNPMRSIIMIDDNGVRWTVPDDMQNAHRQQIAAWEAEGNTIPEEAPAA